MSRDRRNLRIAEVVGVERMHTLYGAPFESGSRTECPYCREETAKSPCVHCGYPFEVIARPRKPPRWLKELLSYVNVPADRVGEKEKP
jgi:hypothetical protein